MASYQSSTRPGLYYNIDMLRPMIADPDAVGDVASSEKVAASFRRDRSGCRGIPTGKASPAAALQQAQTQAKGPPRRCRKPPAS
jgi:hypothetical protein